jgi:UDPglucose 6-dehydrogenase
VSWRTPDTYHTAGIERGTATSNFYETRDNLRPRKLTDQSITSPKRIERAVSRIVIVGVGTVGTVTGEGFMSHGHDVSYVDISPPRVQMLRREGHRACLPHHLNLDGVDLILVSVPTPTNKSGFDFSHLIESTSEIGAALRRRQSNTYPVVVYRSTMLPGSTRSRLIPRLETVSGGRAGVDFGVCYNPEYLRERSASADFLNPTVVLLGIDSQDWRTQQAMCGLYEMFRVEIILTSWDVAEFQKYVHNLANAAKISFFNEMREAAGQIGFTQTEIDLAFSITVKSAESVWQPSYGTLNLGAYGGACLPKDVTAILKFLKSLRISTPLISAVEKVNSRIAGSHVTTLTNGTLTPARRIC